MFERPRSGERALLVRLGVGAPVDPEDLQEFTQLALSAGAQPVATVTGRRARPDPRYFVGSGKAEELKQAARIGRGSSHRSYTCRCRPAPARRGPRPPRIRQLPALFFAASALSLRHQIW